MIKMVTAKEWFRFFDTNSWIWYEVSIEELLEYHQALHDQFGDKPEELIIEIEQRLSQELRSYGIEHRQQDALSKKAGTLVEKPVAPTIDEIRWYLKNVHLESPAIELLQDIDGGRIFLGRVSPLLEGVRDGLVRAMNAAMPPGVKISLPTKAASSKDFVRVAGIYDLLLKKSFFGERITTWQSAKEQLDMSAVAVSKVFRARGGANVGFSPINVVKATEEPEERLVTGVILEPNVIDKTTTNPDGTPTGADGDTYDEVEVRKAMHWWMENGGQTFTYLHPVDGGYELSAGSVRLLENWQARADFTEGDQKITKGTWLATTRVYDDALWNSIKAGDIQSFSIDAAAMAKFEEVPAK